MRRSASASDGSVPQSGVSAYGLAKAVAVTEPAIRAWESSRCSGPSLVVGLKITKALCEDPDYLAYGTETPVHDLGVLAARVDALESRLRAMEGGR